MEGLPTSGRDLLSEEDTDKSTDFGPQKPLPPLTAESYAAIMADIEALLSDSQAFWPADFGTYRGLMIRLAWHCSGSYRQSDGRGGCDGARIRFAPEFLWEDNTNLDKALRILQPLYEKYEDRISWCASETAREALTKPVKVWQQMPYKLLSTTADSPTYPRAMSMRLTGQKQYMLSDKVPTHCGQGQLL